MVLYIIIICLYNFTLVPSSYHVDILAHAPINKYAFIAAWKKNIIPVHWSDDDPSFIDDIIITHPSFSWYKDIKNEGQDHKIPLKGLKQILFLKKIGIHIKLNTIKDFSYPVVLAGIPYPILYKKYAVEKRAIPLPKLAYILSHLLKDNKRLLLVEKKTNADCMHDIEMNRSKYAYIFKALQEITDTPRPSSISDEFELIRYAQTKQQLYKAYEHWLKTNDYTYLSDFFVYIPHKIKHYIDVIKTRSDIVTQKIKLGDDLETAATKAHCDTGILLPPDIYTRPLGEHENLNSTAELFYIGKTFFKSIDHLMIVLNILAFLEQNPQKKELLYNRICSIYTEYKPLLEKIRTLQKTLPWFLDEYHFTQMFNISCEKEVYYNEMPHNKKEAMIFLLYDILFHNKAAIHQIQQHALSQKIKTSSMQKLSSYIIKNVMPDIMPSNATETGLAIRTCMKHILSSVVPEFPEISITEKTDTPFSPVIAQRLILAQSKAGLEKLLIPKKENLV